MGDRSEVGAFGGVVGTGEDDGEAALSLDVADDFGPAFGEPVFFGAGGAGMHHDEGAGDAGGGEGGVGFGAGRGREVERGREAFDGEAEGAEEVEVVVDGVAVADGGFDEFGVERAAEGFCREALPGEAAGGAGERGGEGGAVVAGEVEGDVEAAGGEGEPEVLAAEEDGVRVEGGSEGGGGAVEGEGEVDARNAGAQGGEDGRGEDRVADALELDDQDPGGLIRQG